MRRSLLYSSAIACFLLYSCVLVNAYMEELFVDTRRHVSTACCFVSFMCSCFLLLTFWSLLYMVHAVIILFLHLMWVQIPFIILIITCGVAVGGLRPYDTCSNLLIIGKGFRATALVDFSVATPAG